MPRCAQLVVVSVAVVEIELARWVVCSLCEVRLRWVDALHVWPFEIEGCLLLFSISFVGRLVAEKTPNQVTDTTISLKYQ